MLAHVRTLVHEAALTGEWGGKLAFIGPWCNGQVLQVSRNQHTTTDLGWDPGLLHQRRMPIVVGKVVVQVLGGVALQRRAHTRLERGSLYLRLGGGCDWYVRRGGTGREYTQHEEDIQTVLPIRHTRPRCAAGHGDTPAPHAQWPAPDCPAVAHARRYS